MLALATSVTAGLPESYGTCWQLIDFIGWRLINYLHDVCMHTNGSFVEHGTIFKDLYLSGKRLFFVSRYHRTY